MVVDAQTAEALVSIIFISTRGIDSLTSQLPLQTVDRGDSWLLKGTPYTDVRMDARFIASYAIIAKASAEIIGLGSDARMIPTAKQEKEWPKTMTPEQYARVFGPRTRFEPGGNAFARHMAMSMALYGGLINKPEDAVAYARTLLTLRPDLYRIPPSAMQALERDLVWHITVAGAGDAGRTELMTISRTTGKVLSGDL